MVITAGVNNLKKYGYPKVDSDKIYSSFFLVMLKESLDTSKELNEAILPLIATIEGK